MKFSDSIYWQIYGSIWNFHKKYVDVKDDDKYWEAVVSEAEELCRSYKGKSEYDFFKRLLLSVINELEKVSRRNAR